MNIQHIKLTINNLGATTQIIDYNADDLRLLVARPSSRLAWLPFYPTPSIVRPHLNFAGTKHEFHNFPITRPFPYYVFEEPRYSIEMTHMHLELTFSTPQTNIRINQHVLSNYFTPAI